MPVLVNPYRFAAGASLVDAFVAATESSSNTSAYTFTNHDIGVADASRVVVVGIVLSHAGTNRQISSVTIGGSAATQATDTSSGGTVGNFRIAAIYYRAVAAGTTATIVVNTDNTCDSCGIAVWSLYPSSSTPVDAVSNSSASSASITASNVAISSGGTLVAVSGHNSSGTKSWSWSGADAVSQNVNEQMGDSGNVWSAVTISCTETTTTDDLTASTSGTHNCGIAAASWGP